MDDDLEPGTITPQQQEILRQLLPEGRPTRHFSRFEATRQILLHDPNAAWRRKAASLKQQAFLQERSLWREGLTRGEASDLITQVLEQERQNNGSSSVENHADSTFAPRDGDLSNSFSMPVAAAVSQIAVPPGWKYKKG